MDTKWRFVLVAALAIVAAKATQDTAGAFELFPRPDAQYTVQRGDTLYGVAGLYYSNPALWPFLWNQNPSVNFDGQVSRPENEPLKPGSKLNLYHDRFSFNVNNQSYEPSTGVPLKYRSMVTKIPFKGIPYDKKLFRFKLSNRPMRNWGYIVTGAESTKEQFLDRDLLYVRFRPSKKQAVLVGDRFGVFRDRGPLRHPINSDKKIGHLSEVVGELEIVNTGHELATAIVLELYEPIRKGDKICLFVPRRREIVPTKVHRMLTGTIIYSPTKQFMFNRDSINFENDMVFVDRGQCHGMKEGMLMNIYRPTHPRPDPYFPGKRLNVPDKYIGEGMILKVDDRNSVMLITRSRQEIKPGDVFKSVSD
jgi:hypothetical protein